MMKITTEIMEYGYAFLYERYRLPLYVTECGLSCNDHIFLDGQVHDADRIDFLHRYLLALCRGCERADVRGFFHWSLTDNFEWHSGYAERFGLIYVDYPTQKRILKDSAHWNAQTARENGRNPELFFVYSGAVLRRWLSGLTQTVTQTRKNQVELFVQERTPL